MGAVMAETPSTMLPLGTLCPPFSLPDAVSGRPASPEDHAGKPLLVMFLCNHCPYVVHVMPELGRLGRDYLGRGVGLIAINSNSLESHPQDGPVHMKRLAEQEGWRFPFAFDATQAVARAFKAACTPEFYLFDAKHTLVYRGQLDDSRTGKSAPPSGRDVRAALEAVLAGQPVSPAQVPSVGCNIKWNRG
jgi:thiol-disulfide isomerase/thioredoxin